MTRKQLRIERQLWVKVEKTFMREYNKRRPVATLGLCWEGMTAHRAYFSGLLGLFRSRRDWAPVDASMARRIKTARPPSIQDCYYWPINRDGCAIRAAICRNFIATIDEELAHVW